MTHYHGCPLSGPSDQASRFYQGRHAMVSFAHPKCLPMIAECCQSFVLDNGAFSAWKSGKTFDMDGYAAMVDLWKRHPGFDWHLIPDVIDGSEQDNNDLIRGWITRHEVVGSSPVPVWHLHESLRKLQWLANAFHRVALGSSGVWATPGTDGWNHRMAEAMAAICDRKGRPCCKLHGLRMLDRDVFTFYPFASADSTNAAQNAGSVNRFKTYPQSEAWQRAHIIANGIESENSAEAWVAGADVQLELFV